MKKVYDPKQVEDKWYAYWEQNGFFSMQKWIKPKNPFVLSFPPRRI